MAIQSPGTTLSIESETPDTYTPVGEVTSISGPAESWTVLDVTNLSDTRMRKALGLKDPGQVTVGLQLNYGDAGQDRLRTQAAAKALCNWQIEIPAGASGSGAASDATTLEFAAYISAISINAPINGVITASVTLTVDSDITEAA